MTKLQSCGGTLALPSPAPAPEDSREHQRIKSLLVDELSRVLKTLQKNNVGNDEPIISDDSANAVCNVLEAVFLHGLKSTYNYGGWSLFGSKSDASQANFWPFLQKFAHKGVIAQLDDLNQIRSDIGKCRAWVRLTINDGLMENYLDAMLSDVTQVRHFYINHAFLRDIEKPGILKFYLKGLGEFMFQLSYNSTMLNMWPTQTLFLSGLWAVNDAPPPTLSPTINDDILSRSLVVGPPIRTIMDDVAPLQVSLTSSRKLRHAPDPYDVPFRSKTASAPSTSTLQASSEGGLAPPKLDFRPIAVTPPSQFLEGFMNTSKNVTLNTVPEVTSSNNDVRKQHTSNPEEVETLPGKTKPKKKSDVASEDVDVAIDVATNFADLDENLEVSYSSDDFQHLNSGKFVRSPNDVLDSMATIGKRTSSTHQFDTSPNYSEENAASRTNAHLPESQHNGTDHPLSLESVLLSHFYTIDPLKKLDSTLDEVPEDTDDQKSDRVSTSLPSQSLPRAVSANRRGSEHLIPDFSHLKSDRKAVSSGSSSALATSESPKNEASMKAVQKMRNAMTQKFPPENYDDVAYGSEAENDAECGSLTGNNLNSMSGWSSNFNPNVEGRDVPKAHTVYSDIATIITGSGWDMNSPLPCPNSNDDFDSLNAGFTLVNETEHAVNGKNFAPVSHSFQPRVYVSKRKNSHEDEDFEVIHSGSFGQDQSKVQQLLQLMGKLCSEQGLDSQNFQCHGCQKPIGIIYGKYRPCTYDGFYYCLECHGDDEYYIPSRIIHNWDFAKHKVCKESKCFLIQVQEEPLLDIEKINMKLYEHSDEMKELESLRYQLKYLKAYLFTCKQSVADGLRRMVWPREHLYDSQHLYSLSDLLQAHSGQLHATLQKVVAFAQKHVYSCVLCSQKGFYCEICKRDKVIFPFELETTVQCERCSDVFHRSCKKEHNPCPRCQRRHNRRVGAGSSLETPDAKYLNFTPDFES